MAVRVRRRPVRHAGRPTLLTLAALSDFETVARARTDTDRSRRQQPPHTGQRRRLQQRSHVITVTTHFPHPRDRNVVDCIYAGHVLRDVNKTQWKPVRYATVSGAAVWCFALCTLRAFPAFCNFVFQFSFFPFRSYITYIYIYLVRFETLAERLRVQNSTSGRRECVPLAFLFSHVRFSRVGKAAANTRRRRFQYVSYRNVFCFFPQFTERFGRRYEPSDNSKSTFFYCFFLCYAIESLYFCISNNTRGCPLQDFAEELNDVVVRYSRVNTQDCYVLCLERDV